MNYLMNCPKMTNNITLIRNMKNGLLPITPGLIRSLKIIAILLSALSGLKLRLICSILLLLARNLARNIKLAANRINRLTQRRRRLLLVCNSTMNILRMLLRAKGIMLGELTTILPIRRIKSLIRQPQAVRHIRDSRVLRN